MVQTITASAQKSTALDKEAAIRKAVLDRLGTPPHLMGIKVHNVWEDNWRVNVVCEKQNNSSVRTGTYSDCFFITVSPGGEIIASQPEIKRKY